MEALTIGDVWVVLPLIFGTAVAALFGLGWLESLLCGAALTATSIGITARVLRNVGKTNSIEGRVVLGAAVLDDVAGLELLAPPALALTARAH